MRTAVVRVDVDPSGALSREQLTAGMATLRTLADQYRLAQARGRLGLLKMAHIATRSAVDRLRAALEG